MNWRPPGLSVLILFVLILSACASGTSNPTPSPAAGNPGQTAQAPLPPTPAPGTDTSGSLPVLPGGDPDPRGKPGAPSGEGGAAAGGSAVNPPAVAATAPATAGGGGREGGATATGGRAPAATPAAGAPVAGGPDSASGARPGGCPGRPPSCSPPPPPCRDCPPPTQPQPYQPLRAGSVDDNEKFDEYLSYLKNYRGKPVLPVDVSERYTIAVTDKDQRGVANALVRVYNGQALVFEGRTYANGQTLFFPRATRDAQQATEFTVTAEKSGQTASQPVKRADGGRWVLTLSQARRPALAKLDLLFLIDATGSMQGEISKIQSTLSSIVDRIARGSGQPSIRYGGVIYRDRGDEFVVKKYGFTADLQAFQGWLNGFRAGGGGDYPESLDEALNVAVDQMDWDSGDTVRLVFLVADAPPHLDYQDDVPYTTSAALAVRKGIKLYAVGASGLQPEGEYVFRQLGQLTMARYLFLTRGGDENTGGGPVSATGIQSSETNLDDIIVRIVTQELKFVTG